MTFWSDIHFYLVVSFILTVFFLFKYTHKKISDGLQAKIDDVKNAISSVEKRKKDAEDKLSKLKQDVAEVNDSFEKAIAAAEVEAKKIMERSGDVIASVIIQKELEYKEVVNKIRSSLSIELQNKIVDLAISNLEKSWRESENDRELHNINIENSVDMLEKLVEKRVGNNT